MADVEGPSEQAADSDDEEVCGESFDHDSEDIYEDDDVIQWMCRRCGAEGWETKHPDENGPS